MQASVDIYRVLILPVERKGLEESEMILRDEGGDGLRAGYGWDAIACQGLFAPGLKKETVILAVQIPEEEILMVAHEGYRPRMRLFNCKDILNYLFGLRASVYIISQENKSITSAGDMFKQYLQGGEASMDVTDDTCLHRVQSFFSWQ